MSESYILAVITHNDFLSSDGNRNHDVHRSIDLNDSVIKMITIGDEMQNYLRRLDRVDNHIPELSVYLTGDSKMIDLQVVASETIIACGSGCL